MCGRYRMAAPAETLVGVFGLIGTLTGVVPRYNVAPTDTMPVVVGPRGERVGRMMRWGLLPMWAKSLGEGAKMINARADGVATKPAFRHAFRHRRCLVPTDGWYEWEKPSRQAWLFRRPDRGVFAFAGIWERWRGPDGEVETYSVLTTEANALCRFCHERMPVVLPPEAWTAWTDPEADPAVLEQLLLPAADDAFVARRVGPAVGNVRNEGPAVAEELDPE